jgi:hypothetical protein
LLDITADGTYDELHSKYFEDANSGGSRAARPGAPVPNLLATNGHLPQLKWQCLTFNGTGQ